MNHLRSLQATVLRTLLFTTLTSLSGCAGVTFYSDSALLSKTGIPIYAPKPYLLVSRTGAKEKPVEVSIVYLNDANKVIYAQPHSGFGSSNLTLALSNGQMASFGQQTDTKIPELVTALGGFLTSRATASKSEAEAAQIRSKIGTEQDATSMSEVSKKIGAIAADMTKKISSGGLPGLTIDELQTIKSAAAALGQAAKAISDPANAPSVPTSLAQIKGQIDSLSKLPSPTASTKRDLSLQIVRAWTNDLSRIFDSTKPEKEELPAFEFYEIIQANGTTTLRRVSP